MKVEATHGTKDDPVPSHIQDVPTMNPKPRLTTKVSFKGGSLPSTQTHLFFQASPKSRDEISFKGGSLSHPKIWNVKINKNRNHVACLNLKFHKEIKLFDLI
jgi:hypothetical protein